MERITNENPRYDEERTVFNALIDKRPSVIAKCSSVTDVREALSYALTNNLEVAVRAGGHSVAGFSVNDGGIVIDARNMTKIDVNPARQTVRVEAGATWGEFDQATQMHGLATTGEGYPPQA